MYYKWTSLSTCSLLKHYLIVHNMTCVVFTFTTQIHTEVYHVLDSVLVLCYGTGVAHYISPTGTICFDKEFLTASLCLSNGVLMIKPPNEWC